MLPLFAVTFLIVAAVWVALQAIAFTYGGDHPGRSAQVIVTVLGLVLLLILLIGVLVQHPILKL